MVLKRGSWSSKRGQGQTITFLQAHAGYSGDECLIWPFSRLPNGYGMFGYLGKMHYAHRYMCEQVNGKPPADGYDAAHSCGRGKDGCVHPKHLSWKTRRGNILDAVQHGTHAGNRFGNRGRLTPAQVLTIRRLRGQKTQAEIASMFGITEPSVRDIYAGRTYRSVSS